MGKETVTQVQKVQRVPGRINPRRNTPRHIVIKRTQIKDKERILKAAREKATSCIQGNSHKAINRKDFSAEILQARRKWHNIFKGIKGENLQPRILCLTRLSFRFYGEIKIL